MIYLITLIEHTFGTKNSKQSDWNWFLGSLYNNMYGSTRLHCIQYLLYTYVNKYILYLDETQGILNFSVLDAKTL